MKERAVKKGGCEKEGMSVNWWKERRSVKERRGKVE